MHQQIGAQLIPIILFPFFADVAVVVVRHVLHLLFAFILRCRPSFSNRSYALFFAFGRNSYRSSKGSTARIVERKSEWSQQRQM